MTLNLTLPAEPIDPAAEDLELEVVLEHPEAWLWESNIIFWLAVLGLQQLLVSVHDHSLECCRPWNLKNTLKLYLYVCWSFLASCDGCGWVSPAWSKQIWLIGQCKKYKQCPECANCSPHRWEISAIRQLGPWLGKPTGGQIRPVLNLWIK